MLAFRSRPSRPLGSLALLALILGPGQGCERPAGSSSAGGSPSDVVLVAAGAPAWKYLDDGSDQGIAWFAPGFDDALWGEGAAQLGYGDGDESTVVEGGPEGGRHVTTYFRQRFEVADPADYLALRLRLLRDDGAVVYLNGAELLRSNMPPKLPITSGTLATTGVGGSDETTFYSTDLPATALVAGTNVLAVEIHQSAPSSSDISLDLELLGLAELPVPTPTRTPFPTPLPGVLRFAIVGDFGDDAQPEADVASLIRSWNPELVITLGDNNYPAGDAATIDRNIGKHYQEFIYPYTGIYGSGSPSELGNRFFPSLGNHDWYSPTGAGPYLSYFELPGNERYYQFTRGPVDFFAVDSDAAAPGFEPDGVAADSIQGVWLQQRLAVAASPWQLVYFHHPPFGSGAGHGSTPVMQWPFADWGADVVLSGHEHNYERLSIDGIPYFVNGLGGRQGGLTGFNLPIAGSQFRYSTDHGAMLAHATSSSLQLQFYDRQGQLVDGISLDALSKTPSPTFTPGPSPTYTPANGPSPSVTPLASATPSPAAVSTPTPTPGINVLGSGTTIGAGFLLALLAAALGLGSIRRGKPAPAEDRAN